MKQKKWLTPFMSSLAVVAFLVGSIANGQVSTTNPACIIAKVDGERVPFPLRKANTKFELAENETYLLNGTVVSLNGRPFLRVDFTSQPWLETERMLQFPYFPLDASSVSMGLYSDRMVQVAVVTRKNDSSGSSIEGKSNFKLGLILPPVSF